MRRDDRAEETLHDTNTTGSTLGTRRGSRRRLMAAGGLAYAAIPDAGGVIHSCYTKSSGAWRVIDTGLGQTCKSNEAALDLYSKGGADALFLDQTEANGLYPREDGEGRGQRQARRAGLDRLSRRDRERRLTATSSDGRDSFHFVRGFDAGLFAGHRSAGATRRRSLLWLSAGGLLSGTGLRAHVRHRWRDRPPCDVRHLVPLVVGWHVRQCVARRINSTRRASPSAPDRRGTSSGRGSPSGFHITTLDLYTLVGEQRARSA